MLKSATTYEEVMQLVQQWPPIQRFSLAQALFQSLAPEIRASTHQQKNTWSKALELLATSSPAPTDTQVKEWLDEQRFEKYG